MRCVALFRGVNVGGHNKIAMADIRRTLEVMGYGNVGTYLQSGNAVFSVSSESVDGVGPAIEQQVAQDLGLRVRVLIRTADELARVVAANPFPEAAATPTTLHVSFFSSMPDRTRVSAMDAGRFLPEQFSLGDRCMYLWYPNGAGQAKLTNAVLERHLDVVATARNWKTVTSLLPLLSE